MRNTIKDTKLWMSDSRPMEKIINRKVKNNQKLLICFFLIDQTSFVSFSQSIFSLFQVHCSHSKDRNCKKIVKVQSLHVDNCHEWMDC
jgi:hypothetical protein